MNEEDDMPMPSVDDLVGKKVFIEYSDRFKVVAYIKDFVDEISIGTWLIDKDGNWMNLSHIRYIRILKDEKGGADAHQKQE